MGSSFSCVSPKFAEIGRICPEGRQFAEFRTKFVRNPPEAGERFVRNSCEIRAKFAPIRKASPTFAEIGRNWPKLAESCPARTRARLGFAEIRRNSPDFAETRNRLPGFAEIRPKFARNAIHIRPKLARNSYEIRRNWNCKHCAQVDSPKFAENYGNCSRSSWQFAEIRRNSYEIRTKFAPIRSGCTTSKKLLQVFAESSDDAGTADGNSQKFVRNSRKLHELVMVRKMCRRASF